MSLEELLTGPQYALKQDAKEKILLRELIALTRHHQERCVPYANIVRLTAPNFENARSIDELPHLPTGLFKTHKLQSVDDSAIRSVLFSSGTTGQATSRIAVDDMTAGLQARAFAAVMREAFGNKRLPLLLIENENTLKNKTLNARSAGVLGFMAFGHSTVFALDENMNLKKDAVDEFLKKFGNAPFLVFGLTYAVWQTLRYDQLDLHNGTLVHGGGWKKLVNEAVDNNAFCQRLKKQTGLARIFNFYGMVEQTGTAFLEGEDGLLYPPAFGDVIVRDAQDWRSLPVGEAGIVQVLSLIPHSYPGHSIMTEDRGVIVHIDKGNRMGKALRILGRTAQAELRGCSDVQAFGVAA